YRGAGDARSYAAAAKNLSRRCATRWSESPGFSGGRKWSLENEDARQGRASKGFYRCAQAIVLPNSAVTSAMRFEKPHSLSYQPRMLTKFPSITLVWSSRMVAECGS